MSKLKELVETIKVLKEEYDYWVEELKIVEIENSKKLLTEVLKKFWAELIDSRVYMCRDIVEIEFGERQRGRFIMNIRAEELNFYFNRKRIICFFKKDKNSWIEIHIDKIK